MGIRILRNTEGTGVHKAAFLCSSEAGRGVQCSLGMRSKGTGGGGLWGCTDPPHKAAAPKATLGWSDGKGCSCEMGSLSLTTLTEHVLNCVFTLFLPHFPF